MPICGNVFKCIYEFIQDIYEEYFQMNKKSDECNCPEEVAEVCSEYNLRKRKPINYSEE